MNSFVILVASSIAPFGARAANSNLFSSENVGMDGQCSGAKGAGPFLGYKATLMLNATATTRSLAGYAFVLGSCFKARLIRWCITQSPETLMPPDVLITVRDWQGNAIDQFNDLADDKPVINAALLQIMSGGACTIIGMLCSEKSTEWSTNISYM